MKCCSVVLVTSSSICGSNVDVTDDIFWEPKVQYLPLTSILTSILQTKGDRFMLQDICLRPTILIYFSSEPWAVSVSLCSVTFHISSCLSAVNNKTRKRAVSSQMIDWTFYIYSRASMHKIMLMCSGRPANRRIRWRSLKLFLDR